MSYRFYFLDESKLEKNNGMNDKLDPEMMGRTNPGMNGGMKNGNGNMHSNGHHPLPPDGMYHVSDTCSVCCYCSISVLINKDLTEKALNTLHDHFELGNISN